MKNFTEKFYSLFPTNNNDKESNNENLYTYAIVYNKNLQR